MAIKYLIGTDIGTSGTKTILMDTRGNLLASAYRATDIKIPKALWAEQWPDVWETAVLETIREAVQKAGIGAKDVAGICVSGLYGGSGVPCGRDMEPVRPCIIWMDRRADKQSRVVLRDIGAQEMYRVTRNGTDPYYGYLKMLWIRDNEPENWDKISMFLPPNSYVIYKMTGEAAIDYTSAGNIGGLFDAHTRAWSKKMAERFRMPMEKLPQKIVGSSDIVGGLKKDVAQRLGLLEGTPVCAGGVDCVVAMLGLDVLHPGQHVAIMGTSMTWGFLDDRETESRELISMPYVIEPHRLNFVFGGAATAAAITKWFRDTFAELEKKEEADGGKNAYQLLQDEAAKSVPGSHGLLVLPYFMGERSPLWNVDAKGVIFGLTLSHTKGDVYRAFLEAVAYSLRNTMEYVAQEADIGAQLILSGGVTQSPVWMQIFADVTGYPIVSPKQDVEANLGDVILAGLGTGTIRPDDISKWVEFNPPIQPNEHHYQIYTKYYEQYLRLYDQLKQNMKDISGIA